MADSDVPRADLHMHSCCSDGQLTPAQLVRKAQEHGLHTIAVTDHDTVDGWAAAVAEGAACGVEVVPGTELSVTAGTREIHLLGYGFDPAHAGLRRRLEAMLDGRRERVRRMAERLTELGAPLSFEAVERQAPEARALGRPHVAAALVAAGHVETAQDAFDAYIGDGKAAFVAKPAFPVDEALALLHEAGGIGVLAHPGHWTSGALIRRLVRVGLDGLEVVHPSHDASLTRYYRRRARALGLIETGGSDYHGHRPQDEKNFGAYHVPCTCLSGVHRGA